MTLVGDVEGLLTSCDVSSPNISVPRNELWLDLVGWLEGAG